MNTISLGKNDTFSVIQRLIIIPENVKILVMRVFTAADGSFLGDVTVSHCIKLY